MAYYKRLDDNGSLTEMRNLLLQFHNRIRTLKSMCESIGTIRDTKEFREKFLNLRKEANNISNDIIKEF